MALSREELESGASALSMLKYGTGRDKYEGQSVSVSSLRAAEKLRASRTSVTPKFQKNLESAKAKSDAKKQSTMNAAISQAEANGWTHNGVPVTVADGKLVYDVDKIGANLGLSPTQIQNAKNADFGKRSLSTDDKIKDAIAAGGSIRGGSMERARSAQWQSTAAKMNPMESVISNLSKINPVTSPVDLKNKTHMMNLQVPGQFSDLNTAYQKGRLNDKDNPTWVDKYAIPAVNLGAAIAIGAGALGAAGVFGSGPTALGGAGAAGIGGGSAGAGGVGGGGLSGVAGGVTAGSANAAANAAASAAGTTVTGGTGIGAVAGGGLASGGGAAPGFLDKVGSSLAKNWPGIALGAGSVLGDYISGEQAADRADDYNKDLMNFLEQQQGVEYQRQLERQQAAQDWYEKISLPAPEAVAAARRMSMNTLGQARSNTYEGMFNQMASRGFGSGSGIGRGAAQGIEGDYLKSLGQLEADTTKFANTRQFAPGAQTYGYGPPQTRTVAQQSQPGGFETATGGAADMLGSAFGMYAANQMIGPNNRYTLNWR